MNKPNFSEMSRSELRQYVVQHPQDDEAFYAFADKCYASPMIEVQSMEHLAQLIEETEKARKKQDD